MPPEESPLQQPVHTSASASGLRTRRPRFEHSPTTPTLRFVDVDGEVRAEYIPPAERVTTLTTEAGPVELDFEQRLALAMQTLENGITLGIEEEVMAADKRGQLVNLGGMDPALNVPAAKVGSPEYDAEGMVDGKPYISDDVLGPITEAGDHIREFVTRPFRVRDANDIHQRLSSFDAIVKEVYAKYGLLPLYQSLGLAIPRGGERTTNAKRYKAVEAADPEGFAHGSRAAAGQLNSGTLPQALLGLLTGKAGDTGHVLLAISVSSPFAWTQYDEGANFRWDASDPQPGDAWLIDTGFSSNRFLLWKMMQTWDLTPVAYTNEQYVESRSDKLIEVGRGPQDVSFFHDQDRMQSFGRERRSPDNCRTIQGRELVAHLEVIDLLTGLQEFVNEPEKLQLSRSTRMEALWGAARDGMERELLDPKTGRYRKAWDVARDMVEDARLTLEAYEAGQTRDLLLRTTPADLPPSTIYQRASAIVDLMERRGPDAERSREALARYRVDTDTVEPAPNMITPQGDRVIAQEEARFSQLFVAAEQQLGLLPDPDPAFNLAMHDLARTKDLSLF